MTERKYPAGVVRALFMLSRGRCYEPTCQQPVVRLVKGEPVTNVHIAHICSHEDNGPRCDQRLTEEERRSFRNLILLCMPHHIIVDRKRNESEYPEDLLRHWKSQREGDYSATLAGLENLTEDKLQAMLSAAITQTNTSVTQAINELGTVSHDAAEVLRALKAESFQRPYLDQDTLSILFESASMLHNLEDNATMLFEAATELRGLEQNALTLFAASENLSGLESKVVEIEHATVRMTDAAQELGTSYADIPARSTGFASPDSQETRGEHPRAIRSPQASRTIIRSTRSEKWQYFKWGLCLGAAAVIAMVITIMVMTHHHGS